MAKESSSYKPKIPVVSVARGVHDQLDRCRLEFCSAEPATNPSSVVTFVGRQWSMFPGR